MHRDPYQLELVALSPKIVIGTCAELRGFLMAVAKAAEGAPWDFEGASARMTIELAGIATDAPREWSGLTTIAHVWIRRTFWRNRLPWEWTAGRKDQAVDNLFIKSWAAVVEQPAPREKTSEPRPKRGRPKADYKTVLWEAQFADDWTKAKDSGRPKSEFAQQNGMAVKQLDALLDRVAKRKRRSE